MPQNSQNRNKKLTSSRVKADAKGTDSLKPLNSSKKEAINSLKNFSRSKVQGNETTALQTIADKTAQSENPASSGDDGTNQPTLSYAANQKLNRQRRILEKDQQLLNHDHWLARNGHTFTYLGIFLFTFTLYFRPYELIPALSDFSSMAFVIAIATLLIYLPTQFFIEGSLTTLSTEIKCVLFLAAWAVLTIPIAKDPSLAWLRFSGDYIKVVIIFVIMVNTLRTKSRLEGLMLLSISVGVMLSYQALVLYQKGEFKTEGYRVSVDFGGMFGNPNDMALHLVISAPIAFVLGIASKNKLAKLFYFAAAAIMVVGNMVTQSRGAFLGLVAVGAVLVWKLARNNRLKAVVISSSIAMLLVIAAPGNYGLRILSIFIPSLDPNGSSSERSELLKQSILVTLRNPLGIGFSNFPVVGIRNLQTHNAYTQVSSELGWIAFAAYLILLISPLRKLGAIERQMFEQEDFSWIYYLSIGVQASIAAYMVSSFFGPVAYQWYIYYLIAYAVCLRRIYQVGQSGQEVGTVKKAIS